MRKGRFLQALADGVCTGAVTKNTFVGYDYNTAAAGVAALGVAEESYNIGELVNARTIGTAMLKLGSGGALVGSFLTGDASGFGIIAAAGNAVNAVALEAGNSGDVVEVFLTHSKASTVNALAVGETTLIGGSKAVTISGVTTSSRFIVARRTLGASGTPGNLSYAPTTNTLTISSDQGTDVSVVDYIQIA